MLCHKRFVTLDDCRVCLKHFAKYKNIARNFHEGIDKNQITVCLFFLANIASYRIPKTNDFDRIHQNYFRTMILMVSIKPEVI